MVFEIPTELKNKSLWTEWTFYSVWFLLVVSVACYGMFFVKAYLRQQEISAIDKKIAVYGSSEQKEHEKQVFAYKKKIEDFAKIIENHTISSQVFAFIEKVTLPNVWFSNFSLSESGNQIVLSGETENLETLSRQIDAFEKNKEYVLGISVANSQVSPGGRIVFVLNLLLEPKIFNYGNQ